MRRKDLSRTIDLANRDFSLVLVTPRENLLAWLATFAKQKDWEGFRLYVPEENMVLIIPSIERFSEPGSLSDFLDRMKPKLLHAELVRFDVSPEELGHPVTRETFDEFFEIDLRDANAIHFLSDFRNL